MPTIAPLDLDGHCLKALFVNDIPVFGLAEGSVHRLDGGHKCDNFHDGLLSMALARDGTFLITGGEDGRVCQMTSNWQVEELAGLGRKWVTSVATGPGNIVGFASGRDAYVMLQNGETKELAHPRAVEGLAFAPKGTRLAVARYNGATLHFPAASSKATGLEWAGAHTGIDFSPNGNFLITTMQENALHGWVLSSGKHMRMTGYPAKVKSWSWSNKGKWLATSGAQAAIVWPFSGKEGPMGKAPKELGTRGDILVSAVACHPKDDVVAIGYSDGTVLVCRIEDGNEALLRRGGKGAITSMAWDRGGLRIAFGSEAGDCGIVDISG